MKVSRRFQLTVQTVLFIAVYSDKKEMTCENISKEMKYKIKKKYKGYNFMGYLQNNR